MATSSPADGKPETDDIMQLWQDLCTESDVTRIALLGESQVHAFS